MLEAAKECQGRRERARDRGAGLWGQALVVVTLLGNKCGTPWLLSCITPQSLHHFYFCWKGGRSTRWRLGLTDPPREGGTPIPGASAWPVGRTRAVAAVVLPQSVRGSAQSARPSVIRFFKACCSPFHPHQPDAETPHRPSPALLPHNQGAVVLSRTAQGRPSPAQSHVCRFLCHLHLNVLNQQSRGLV